MALTRATDRANSRAVTRDGSIKLVLETVRKGKQAVSFSCLSDNRTMAQCKRCRVSEATGGNDCAPILHEWNKNWQSNYKMTEYKMERLNEEIRDREKVMRGLKKEDTPILKGYQIFHNYVRPHEALAGKTPAEACGIKVQGENKWVRLIQNASKSMMSESNA